MSALEKRLPGLLSRLFRGCGCCGGLLLLGALAALAATLLVLDSCQGAPSAGRSPAARPLSTELPRFSFDTSRIQLPNTPLAQANESLLAEALACILRGELSRAREKLRPLAPGDRDATLLLALVEDRLGDPDRAKSLLRDIEDRSQRARELLRFID